MAVRDQELTLARARCARGATTSPDEPGPRSSGASTWPKVLATAIVFGHLGVPLAHRDGSRGSRSRRPTRRSSTSSTTSTSSRDAARTTLGTRCVRVRASRSVIGTVVGALVARVPVLRAAIGSMITGLQTMPSVAWFPAAVLVFHLSEAAIIFVVVLGAAPSIANGLINGIDNIPPVLLRASRVLGARRLRRVPQRDPPSRACRRSSVGSSRVGRSHGGACLPVSCSC